MTFLGVAWNGSRESMEDFVALHDLTFPSLVDVAGDVFARYDVPQQPAWVFINDQGEVTRVLGSLDSSSLQGYLNDLAPGVA